MSILTVGLLSLSGYWQFADCDTGLSKNQGDAFKIYKTENKLKVELLFINSIDRALINENSGENFDYVFKNKRITMKVNHTQNELLKIMNWTYDNKSVVETELCIYKRLEV
ncbi:hypothetical protein [Tenacibaculum sp.]|uniref:hypothetical protein n=1 Tax=Tenacibaculum sp. TaxID=1906242 RepID=UPI003AA93EB7